MYVISETECYAAQTVTSFGEMKLEIEKAGSRNTRLS